MTYLLMDAQSNREPNAACTLGVLDSAYVSTGRCLCAGGSMRACAHIPYGRDSTSLRFRYRRATRAAGPERTGPIYACTVPRPGELACRRQKAGSRSPQRQEIYTPDGPHGSEVNLHFSFLYVSFAVVYNLINGIPTRPERKRNPCSTMIPTHWAGPGGRTYARTRAAGRALR